MASKKFVLLASVLLAVLFLSVADVSGAYEYDCSNYWCPPGEECYMHYLYCFRGECKYTPRCKKKAT
ncbi:hypothetical protein B7P43_G18221 [Cryptotermes secundus]|uniref:Uncharacterized protein n=1 Tax=Cryptotermes secundus TaxID=105785 RepID=A0A2J7R938_9NEOP|nr:hypothetical protein B7P43_G18221 [Cryptotermes secundus]